MPIYVFKCHKCKEIKEELFKNIYNNEIIICPVKNPNSVPNMV